MRYRAYTVNDSSKRLFHNITPARSYVKFDSCDHFILHLQIRIFNCYI